MQPTEIVARMYDQDAFSQWLGIELMETDTAGACRLRMTVRGEMLNGFGIAHGGIAYAFADSAFAFACNNHGRQSVSIETSISHFHPIRENDVLTPKPAKKV